MRPPQGPKPIPGPSIRGVDGGRNDDTHGARTAGLTVAELLLAISLLVTTVFLFRLVVNALLTQLETRLEQARRTKARLDIRVFAEALERYAIDNGDYPSTEEGLAVLFQENPDVPAWRSRYLKGELRPDPWGTPYVYRYPGHHAGVPYDLISYGKDRKPGGTGPDADVANWTLLGPESP